MKAIKRGITEEIQKVINKEKESLITTDGEQIIAYDYSAELNTLYITKITRNFIVWRSKFEIMGNQVKFIDCALAEFNFM